MSLFHSFISSCLVFLTPFIDLEALAQWKKPSTKQKSNLLNGRSYLQMICPIKGYYPNYIKFPYSLISEKLNQQNKQPN